MKAEKYLALLAKQIHNSEVREDIILEYANHIEEYKEELLGKGMEEAEAEKMAVDGMGDPVFAGRRMNRLYSSCFDWNMMFWTVFLIGLVLLYYWIGQMAGISFVKELPKSFSIIIGVVFLTLGCVWAVVEKYNDFALFYSYAKNWYGGYFINSGVYLAFGILFLSRDIGTAFVVSIPVLVISFLERFCINILRERKEEKYLWEIGTAQTCINYKGKINIANRNVKVKAKDEEIPEDSTVVVTSFEGFVPVVEKI